MKIGSSSVLYLGAILLSLFLSVHISQIHSSMDEIQWRILCFDHPFITLLLYATLFPSTYSEKLLQISTFYYVP